MFRRLYWVSEQVFQDGTSELNGVYTSIPDLIRNGLRFPNQGELRLSLTKLDSESGVLGVWNSPGFDQLEEEMEPFIKTEEFSKEQVNTLIATLQKLTIAA